MYYHRNISNFAWIALQAMLGISLVATVSCKDKEQEARLAALESAVATASSASKDATAQVQAVSSANAEVSARLAAVEQRTPGIGYFMPGWSYRGLTGATSLSIRATPVKGEPDHCRISGAFEHSSTLPSPVVLTVFKEGGESVFETSVTLAEGAFDVKSAAVRCEHVNKVSFAPKN